MKDKGAFYEQLAADYLVEAGLVLLERNYQCKAGEIDIIGTQDEHLVFVEVRFRSNSAFGTPAATVDWRKQQKIIRTARVFLKHRPAHATKPCRFDVIAISPSSSEPQVTVQWLKSAFTS